MMDGPTSGKVIRADADWLLGNPSQSLIAQPLWLNDVRRDNRFQVNFPLWARRPFDSFKKSLLVTDGPWGVWLDWYQLILIGEDDGPSRAHFGREIAVVASTQPNQFWERDPARVTADVASLTTWQNRFQSQTSSTDHQTYLARDPELNDVRNLLLGLISRRAEQLRSKRQSVEPQSDEPTAEDQLGRRPFAQALVERMDRIYEKGGHDGFAAHIYAPWGAGKTSVLMMMRDLMIASGRKSTDGRTAPHWVVVRFNAWEQERRNPPWWPLVEAVKGECLTRLSGASGGWKFAFSFFKEWWVKGYQVELQPLLLQFGWIWWKLKTDALP